MFFNKKDKDSKQRFGIRKLTVGACSVLLSTLILGVEMQESTSKVQAATTDTSNNYSTTEPAKNSKNTYLTSSEVKETTTEATSVSKKEKSAVDNAGQNLSKENDDKTVIPSASVTENNKLNTVSNKTESNTEEDSAKTEALNNNEENKNTGDSNKENTANANTVAEDTASLDLNKVKDNGRINNLKDTVEISLLKSATVSKLRTLSSSNDIAEADEIKDNATVTIPSTDGRYTLYISRNTWGNTIDGDQPAKVLLSGSVLAGDTVTISIPSYGIVGVNYPNIDANYGSSSIKDVGNNKVVTYNFTASGVINPIITIPADNGYGGKPTPMQIVRPTVKDITWTVNGVEQTSAEFHIDVNPVWNPKFSLSKPNPNSTDQNVLKKMIPNYESIYQLAINETNGVAPGQDYSNTPHSSQKINSAVNYGTVITIPMPKGYVLDQSATMQLNNFGDKTTITQEGNNVIITVPKGSGKQNWNSGPAYQLVGSYDIAMPATATTYTADAPITIVQKLNDDGSQTKTWNGPTVSQDFYGANDQIPLGQMPIYARTAYNAYNRNQLLNNGHKQIVAYFGITNESIASYNDYSSNFTFNFVEGLGVTELKTPTIPGTSNYKYTITYADGTTSEGQVNAGETITGTGVITNIVVSPDDFERDQSTATNLPLNNFAYQTTVSVNAFEAYGAVPNSVKPGTQLAAKMTFTGTVQQGNVTRYLTSTAGFDQNVVSPADLTSSSSIFGHQDHTTTGQSNVGYLSVTGGGAVVGEQTNNIYEPIFYYVLPDWFSVYDFSTDYTKLPDFRPNTNNGVVGTPKLSLFTVPTEISGLSRQVVKIDYSGTGYNFLAGQNANNLIHLNTLPDGTNGTYQGMIYIVSPTTKLTNTAYNPDNTSNFAPSGITFNPDWVQGNTSSLYYIGSASYSINQVGGVNTASVAQGNQNDILVDSGVTNLYDSNKMKYGIRLINVSGSNLANVVALVNLPQASDTSFTFQLSGRPVYDGDKSGYTFLYSTELGDLKKNSDPDGTKPDETGYVPANQVTDWSKIKSIIIKVAALSNNERSDRLVLTGTDPDLVNDAGKTGYLSTGFYSDTTKPFVSSLAVYNASTLPNKVKPANITVTGAANINFKLQYTDENGQLQTVDLPKLSTSYNLAQNNTMLTEQEAIDLANKNAASSIPANYEIKSATLQSGGKTWQTNAPEETPVFGEKVQYFYNNATVNLQAVPIQRTLTYQVIDENDPSSPVTIQLNTDLLSNGQAITGNQGSTVPTDASAAYEAVKSALEKQHYVISSNSSTVPETFGPDNTELTIYVTHKTAKVSTPDQWPSSSTETDKVPLSETITRTITVAGLPTNVPSVEQNVNFTRTAIVDEVTGKVIGYVDPSNSTKTITDGDAAWTSTNNQWDAFVPSNVPAGYSIESITDANGNYSDVTSADGKLTGVAQTTVSANESDVTVTITYQGNQVSNTITFSDTDDNNKPVGETITISGRVGETDSNLNLTVPEGYELANGASLPTSYTFEATNTPITIPLVHKHKIVGPNDTWPSSSTDTDKVALSKTLTRTIKVEGLPTPVEGTTQSVTFNRTAIVDEVTGKVIGYVDPSNSTKTITDGDAAWTSTNNQWDAFVPSNVPAGYSIESITDANGNYSDVTSADGKLTGVAQTTVSANESDVTVTITYQGNQVSNTITFSDTDDNNKPVGETITISGRVGETDSNLNLTVPEGYELANGASLPTSYTFEATNTPITIPLVHKHKIVGPNDTWPSSSTDTDKVALSKTLTRTIKVEGLPTPVEGTTQSVTFNRTAIVDEVTGKVIGYVDPSNSTKTITDGDAAWTSTNNQWDAFVPSNVPAGYSIESITDANGNYSDVTSADGKLTGVAQTTVSANESDVTVTITYQGNQVSNTITFSDTDDNNKPVGETITISGRVGETDSNLNLTVPEGYELANGASLPTSYTFEATNTPITIPLVHKHKIVGPNDTWPSSSTEKDKVPLSETITRTITVAGLPTNVPSVEQNVNFTRTAIVDEVTGKVIGYVDPRDSTKTITDGGAAWTSTNATWSSWASSTVPAGYYIESAKVGNTDYPAVTTNANGIITGLNSITVTPEMNSITVNVVYNKVSLDLTINHDLITNTYNGSEQPVSADVISAITHTATSSNSDIPVPNIARAIQNASLTSDDYSYTDSQGSVLSNAPTNAGNYRIILNQNGLDKLNKVAGGLTINYDPSKSYVNYTIEKAEATAKLEGNNSKTYDGKAVTTPEINAKDGTVEVTITIPNSIQTVTYKLQNGDYTWNTPNGDAPSDVGSYRFKLSPEGLTNLQSAIDSKWGEGNVKITDADLKGEATFMITKDNIKISGNGSQTGTYTGSPQVVDPTNFPITLTPESDAPVPTIPDGTLTSDDFVVKNKGGKPVNPTDVGDYTVYLTPDGIDKLKKLNPNYNWPTTEQEVGNFTITPAKMDVTLSGNDSKVSDGQPANVDLSTLVDNLTGVNLNRDGLTLDDFSWNTSDGSAPIEVGNYTITLNENGLNKLQINNSNYTVNVTGEFKYAIIAASQKIEYVDGNGNIIKVIDNIGTDASNYGEKVDFDVKQNVPENYKLVNSNVPTQVTVENGVTRFVIEPNIVTTTDTKTVTRTIIVENPDGSENKVVQTVTFTRPKYTDPVNSEVTYGEWDKSSGSWDKYNAPDIPGYTSNEVPGARVTPNTADKTVTVKYTKNPPIETTETKTIIRTIIVEDPDGSETQVVQKVTFTRPKYTDPVNGEVTYGEWNKPAGNWDKYNAPDIPGYTSNEVPGARVTPNTADKTVTVKYTKNPPIETTETKTITRTIIVENPDGSETQVVQKVTFTRPKYTDPVNGEVTYGEWDKPAGNWDKYSAPDIPGYTSNEVPVEEVTPNTADKTVTVKYTKNPPIETTETKTITRTIIVENPDGSETQVVQKVTFTRPKYTDPVNGEVTYGEWNKPAGNWDKYNAPDIPGYTSNEVPGARVTPNTADKTVTVKYTKNPPIETTETKTITRTIIVENPDGSETQVVQKVTFTRPKYTDPVNGEVTYGEWDKPAGNWDKYNAPDIPGYTSNEVPVEEVTPNTADKTVTVKYTKNPPIETTETKTIIRTIIVENPDGSETQVVQKVTFTRPKYTDPVNGEVTYGEWDKPAGNWDKYSAPDIPGYTSNEVPGEVVTPSTEDKTVTVKYTKNPAIETTDTKTVTRTIIVETPDGSESKVVQTVTFTRPQYTDPVNGEVTYGEWDKSSGNWNKYNAPEIPGYTSNEVPGEVVTPSTEDKTVTVKYTKNPAIETTDTKTVTRTIIVETPDGSESKVVQTVTFTRPQYTDPVNGEVTYGEWDKSSGNWNKYNVPEIPGYTSNEVPGEVVTPSTEDKTVTVKYTKNPAIETTDTKTVTRTIIVETPDGSESKVVQTVTFTRPQYTDPVNGEVTYGEWDKSSGNWNKYNAPEIPGYTSNEVPGEVVTPSTEDKTVTVKYTKNPAIETTDTKTVTRTIIVETPDGSENKVVQTVTFTRPKYTDPVNGEVTYGEWDKSSGNWNKYNAPEIPGYTSNEVPGEVVTPSTEDKTVTVKYTKNPAIETTDTKTVTRTIIVETPDGSESKVVQTVTFTRPQYTDPVNGEVTYGEWDKSSGNWNKYNAPEIPGYTSNEVPGEVVTPSTEDKTVTVKYTKNPAIETTDTKTVTRTIIVETPDGSESKVVQTVTFTRPQYTDPVNGEVTYGEWDKSSGNWNKYNAPEIPGYTSNEVPGEVVTPSTEDKTVTVKYTKNPAIETTDTKTVTRTIIVETPDGSENKVVQTVTFTRPKYTDPVNGEVTYGEWDKSSGNWNKYNAPEIPGYTSNEVPGEVVTPSTEDKTVTVKYTKNPAIETTDTKTVTRTIIVETPDGSENKVVQTVTFTRPKYTDPVNGEVTYGEWDKSSGNWNKYNAPEIPGYTSNEVPGEVVTPSTEDKTVTVKYTKNPAIETTDTKTVTRTIIVETPDGSENKVVQTVTFTRPKYTDPVNGEVTYGEWDKSSGNWNKYNAPEIPGYTSNEVPGEVVTPDTEDQTIRIGYSKQQEPETPTIPSQPADKKYSGKVSAVKQQVSTTKISKTNIVNTVQKKVGKQTSRNRAQVNKNNDHTLPQTGAHKDMLAIISGALAVGIGLLGLSLDRKKKK